MVKKYKNQEIETLILKTSNNNVQEHVLVDEC